MEYQYPIAIDWATEEIIDAVQFFEAVERAYEKGMDRDELMSLYRRFKEIVPSKSEEKKIDKEFEEESGYSTYRVIKKAKDAASGDFIKMK
ncbi:UPF0223 family protein [Priestia koreensis]|uniref:UPF0223 protein AMD01_02285 n=1 Tax=Priestia koreensis TaxID=284581 RepID=A0A0M0LHZ5_9BACI|nr:UPF0223 family protein [Priestia koreensis]KOO50596.1 hypothetical protein AMD01_02285 [Priestia koreensis]MCM3003173.1 UPF0223 family protein [Priestia koreensis]UNL85977.1 UPF0223 family protein [Priestia koreensis]